MAPAAPAAAQSGFPDVEGSVHADAVNALASDGVVRGCRTDAFCPGDPTTRAQLAALLVRLHGLDEPDGAPFPDVPASHVHSGAIAAAVEAGYVRGYEDGTFGPGSRVTRSQAASMVARSFGLDDGDAGVFRDVGSSPHRGAIGAIVQEGITNGCGALRFCPSASVTRAQAASFLARASGAVPKVVVDLGSHDALLADLVGYGDATRGGAGGDTVWVTTTADSGPGSLREAATASGARWVRFDPGVFAPGRDARISLDSSIDVTGRVTIDGRGADVTIQNHGFFIDEDDVIVTGLTFDFDAEHTYFQGNSAFTIGWPNSGVQRIWVHRNTFLGSGPGQLDGAVDMLRGANRITVSWNHFVEWDKSILTATDPVNPDEASDLISIHHNHFERNGQRQPLARFGRFHVWNNWFDHWDFNGSYGEAIVATSDAQVLSERNVFDHSEPYRAIIVRDEGAGTGAVRDVGSYFAPPVQTDSSSPSQVTFDPSDDHAYTSAPVDTSAQQQALRDRLSAGAGS